MAQLVERSLPIPEVGGSNPVIGKNLFIYWTFVYCQLWIEKTKIKKKEAGSGPFLKKLNSIEPSQDWVQDLQFVGNILHCKPALVIGFYKFVMVLNLYTGQVAKIQYCRMLQFHKLQQTSSRLYFQPNISKKFNRFQCTLEDRLPKGFQLAFHWQPVSTSRLSLSKSYLFLPRKGLVMNLHYFLILF